MSVPTIRTPRSPFNRSARRSAAVPGAPEAVTRTVMSRIDAAMLLKAAACDADRLLSARLSSAERLCLVNQFEPAQGLLALIPVIVLRRFDADPKIVGFCFAAFGAGALVGSLVAARLV